MEVKHFRPKLPSRAVARGPVITQSVHRVRVGCVVWRPRLPGMGRRELVAAGEVFPPQAPRLGPVAGRAGAWCQCSAVPPPSLALQPTSRLKTQHRDRGQDGGIVTLEQSGVSLTAGNKPSRSLYNHGEGRRQK